MGAIDRVDTLDACAERARDLESQDDLSPTPARGRFSAFRGGEQPSGPEFFFPSPEARRWHDARAWARWRRTNESQKDP